MNFIYKLMANRHVRKLLKLFNLDKPVVLCVGDSLTYGTGAPKDDSYPFILQNTIDYPVISAGHPGSTSQDWLRLIDSYLQKWRPDVVIFCIGTNDQMLYVHPFMVFENICTVIDKILLTGAKPLFIIPATLPNYPKIEGTWDRLRLKYPQLPMLDGAISQPKEQGFTADGVHLNAYGYLVMACMVTQALQDHKLLERKT